MTRPAKSILVVSPNLTTGSILAIQARVWGYIADTKDAYNDAVSEATKRDYDLVLLVTLFNPITWRHLAKVAVQVDAVQRGKYRRTMIVDPQGKMPGDMAQGVDRIVSRERGSEHLRESIRLAMTRKRGPRPKEIINLKLEAA